MTLRALMLNGFALIAFTNASHAHISPSIAFHDLPGFERIGYLDDQVKTLQKNQEMRRQQRQRNYEEARKVAEDCNTLSDWNITQATRDRVSKIHYVRESTLDFRGAEWTIDLGKDALAIPYCEVTFDSARGLVSVRGYTTNDNGKKIFVSVD